MSDYVKGLDALPDHMRGGMRRYIEHGIKPGSFLRAVLENDLMEACGQADIENRHRLFGYASYLYNDAPPACYGSKGAVKDWIEAGGLVGRGQLAKDTPVRNG